ncbi:MAG: hypothetical protein ACT6Q5_11555 [Sphingopyxis solisilvae]|uniref:hypothetical protein n=1 Tax=Sphingopyxis solisilvae TaxID=1886788 RepID=UPI0040360961
MSNNAFLIVFDTKTVEIDQKLHQFIIQNRLVDKWWTFISGTYAILSSHDIMDLDKSLREYVQKGRFIIAPFDPEKTNGWLPKTAWAAFQQDIESVYKKRP